MKSKEHDFHGLTHSATLLEERLRQELAPLDIHPRQARVLTAIHHMEPVSQVALAEAVDITPASMSTMTDRLLAAGYITREPDPETRRRNVLKLTAAGRAKLDAILTAWDAMDDMLCTLLGPADAQELARLTKRLRAGLGGTRPGERRG